MKRSLLSLLLIVSFCLALTFAFTASAETNENWQAVPESYGTCMEMQDTGALTPKQCTKIKATYDKTMYLGYGYSFEYTIWYKNYSHGSVWIETLTPKIAYFSDGYIFPLSVGTAKFKLHCDKAKCTLTIKCKAQPATNVTLSDYSVDLVLGNIYTLDATVEPECYADQTVTYSSSNKKVATVDKYGIVTGKKEGDAIITVKSKTKGVTATCRIHVYDPVTRRAVVIGECSGTNGSYSSESQRIGERIETEANMYGMASLFTKYKFSTVKTIESWDNWTMIANAIKGAFSGADSDDISYLYIEAHGGINNGEYIIAIGSGNSDYIVTATQLKNLLDSIPGKKVLFLESCHSGTIINKGQNADSNANIDNALEGFVNTFRGSKLSSKGTTISGSDYCVMCATHGAESCWCWWGGKLCGKKKFVGGLFTFWMAKGAGWDIVDKKACKNYADDNKNNAINMEELFAYTYKNVEASKRKYCDSNVKQITVDYEGFSDALFVTKK